jgi:hypothetical protein
MEKTNLVNKMKEIFNKNAFLSAYSPYLCPFLFDNIFDLYVKEYVERVDENDVETIKSIIEVSLQMKLNEFLTVEEVYNVYLICKEYIKILLKN